MKRWDGLENKSMMESLLECKWIMDQAKKEHFRRVNCLYCNSKIKPPKVFCKPSCAKKFNDILGKSSKKKRFNDT